MENVKSKTSKKVVSKILISYNTYIMFAVLIIICMIISPDFFTVSNLTNIGRQYAGAIVVAMGMLMVILTGGIDLSVGSIVALGSVIMATMLNIAGCSMFASVVVTIAVGAGLGLFAGFLVARMNMAPFIVSLAMMTVARGIAFMISNGSPIKTPANSIGVLGTSTIFGSFPTLVLLALIVVFIFWMVLKYTSFGRLTVALGSNETAVSLAGIRVKSYKASVYMISGICASLGGIIAASRTAIGSPVAGTSMDMDAIAACVIGGASLSGGEGSAVKTLIGVLILALIGNIMNLLAVPSYPQDVIKGFIIIASVLLQVVSSAKKKNI
jgi:ribose transport system permease protein